MARHRARTNPAFAAEVARWRGQLATLALEVPALPAPPASWQRIKKSLAFDRDHNIVVFRRRLNFWRGATAAAMTIAASLALVFVTRDIPRPVPSSPTPMVALIRAGTGVAAVASWDSGSRRLLVSEVNMPVTPRRDYELWLIPSDGKPHSLGVMPNAPHMQLALTEPVAAMVGRGAILAVSLEPSGGSRAEGPSGPVVASGKITTA